jgi:hypothetical protein
MGKSPCEGGSIKKTGMTAGWEQLLWVVFEDVWQLVYSVHNILGKDQLLRLERSNKACSGFVCGALADSPRQPAGRSQCGCVMQACYLFRSV